MIDTDTLTKHRSGMFMRPGTIDDYIIGERRSYLALNPTSNDVLLDIGGNIGSVARLFLEEGVKGVISIEPDPENVEMLKLNTAGYTNLLVLQAAVVQEARGPIELWLNKGKNKGLHSTVQRRGRDSITVAAYSLDSLLEQYRPSLVKIDIEGAEYELEPTVARLPAFVRGLALEFDLQRPLWRSESAPRMLAAIEAQGFVATRAPKLEGKHWASMGVWLR